MKRIFILACCFMLSSGILPAQKNDSAGLRFILLQQLKTTHDVQDWFVPLNQAITGLTAEQASWKNDTANHSIAQLVSHLAFWNEEQLDKFTGRPTKPFDGDNTKTFSQVDATHWQELVKRSDSILRAMESFVATTSETSLKKFASAIAHVSAHNAYHIGQIMFIRKAQGSWDGSKGVK